MQFEISHEFDVPLDVVELAVLSPELGTLLAAQLTSIESVETVKHDIRDGELHRVLRFQAAAPLSIFRGAQVAREAMRWEETVRYRIGAHHCEWRVTVQERFQKYFESHGTYRLVRLGEGRTRRVVHGHLDVHVSMIKYVVERMALSEVRKTYDAEAAALRQLATL